MFRRDLNYLIEKPGNVFTSSIVILLAFKISIYGSKAGCETIQHTGPAPRPFSAAIHNFSGQQPVPTVTELRLLSFNDHRLGRNQGR